MSSVPKKADKLNLSLCTIDHDVIYMYIMIIASLFQYLLYKISSISETKFSFECN